jgi:ABC-type nitrate/sulfonate/bicarbonate transport system permease component
MSQQRSENLLDTLTRIRFSDSRVIFIESVIVIILTWTLAAHVFGVVDVISKPSLIGVSMYEIVNSPVFAQHMVPTLRRTALGLFVTILIGTTLGIGMGMRDWIKKAFQDYVTIGLAMPGLFIAIFAAMWFGISDLTPMVAAGVIAFPFLTQNVFEGVRNIDNEILQMATSYNVSRRRVIRRIVVPGIMSEWFAGMRYSLAIVWKTVTLAELVAADTGIGFIIRDHLERLDFTGAMAWTILFVFVVLFIEYGILQQLEKRIFSWRQDVSGVMAV